MAERGRIMGSRPQQIKWDKKPMDMGVMVYDRSG